MVRYHEPPPFWGPKAKPKKCKTESTLNEEKTSVTLFIFYIFYLKFFFSLKLNSTKKKGEQNNN